ncbi:TrkH family potassium uptake protein [Cocleimonas sp. KMM 6892]|uniref:TrkH family potassium uptake protein n=1 Tax=unclassified Cocleimonas TaxID=2639732 RepID=UPI002DBCF45C|nr:MULTISPECIES: TrkH family potassium uptake protein [unclassified Cocleimonas]MEB8432557.1 TrkH family potassium uptake protein [Cocleimonas sp. KMM 6892]MEC4715416.1 TrkH family potassium uptake protein [Cocleimonas sp. KMM 6895]MEC4744965.1 TrkH family potassium uptake protein [Cocleimonas sp. KMM 6896]
MQLFIIQRILGLLMVLFSFTMLPPVLVGWIYNDLSVAPFIKGFLLVLIVGAVLWFPVRHRKRELRLREGFLVVVLFWSVLGIAGSAPLIFSHELQISFVDAVFESVSALTTTGATVIVGLDDLPKSILFYRQQLQWLGGMGIIVLAVAILPILGIGGIQLYRAEAPGPVKDSKLTPRIKGTAKLLWIIYLTFTVTCAVAYYIAGMDVFDAISHSFSTVAIGGFSTHDASMGYFNSHAIELVAVVFMLLSGANFSLHFIAWRSLSLTAYQRDSEFRLYGLLIVMLTIVSLAYLYFMHVYGTFSESYYHAMFQVVSIATTTGFTTTDYSHWPGFLPVLLVLASFVGGCAGSTGGGMKVIRVLLLFKQGWREVLRLIHPNARIAIKLNKKPVDRTVIQAVWGFFSVYVGIFLLFMMILMAAGMDQVTAFSAVAATLNNLGPGLGEVAQNYQEVGDFSKWLLCLSMLMGRLEIFTLLVVLTPAFWRK